METLHFPENLIPRNVNRFALETLKLKFSETLWDVKYDSRWGELLRRNEALLQEMLEPFTREDAVEKCGTHIELECIPFLLILDHRQSVARIYSRNGFYELHAIEQSSEPSPEATSHLALLRETLERPQTVDIDYIRSCRGLPDFKGESYQDVYHKTLEWESRIGAQMKAYRSPLFEKFSNALLNLTADFPLVRIHLLKFLAILPSLDHDTQGREVKRILQESFRRLLKDNTFQEKKLPFWLSISVTLVLPIFSLIPARILATVVRMSVRATARRFIAGETISVADRSIKALLQSGRTATLDQLGELVVSPSEADTYLTRVLELIEGLSRTVEKGARNAAGILSAHVSVKVTALGAQIVPEDFEGSYKQIAPRLIQILLAAKEHHVFINIDAEHHHVRDLVLSIYSKVLLETPELHTFEDTGIVLQAYLRDAHSHLDKILNLAQKRKIRMPIRLVKGAYWDAETVEAEAHGFAAPQFQNKVETDIHYRQLVHRILSSAEDLQLCVASHNLFDHAFAESLRELRFPQAPTLEHQCLHMTYEALSVGLARSGLPVRNYVPIGSLLVGMAYLVRRIMENSSQVGFLTQMRQHRTETTFTPSELLEQSRAKGTLALHSIATLDSEFRNIPPVRLFEEKHRRIFEKSKQAFLSHPKIFEHPHLSSGDWVAIVNPSEPEQIVGRVRFASQAETHSAVQTIHKSTSWSHQSAQERSATLLKAAILLTTRRLEWAHWIIAESGKSVREALADVDEAIDFLNYYSTEALKLKQANPVGPTAVIAPWNFPLAISCGMTTAALAAGNPTILKPAEQTPLIASLLVSLLHEAGVPQDALIYLPGMGETVGKTLTESPHIRSVVFTGSKAVGQLIAETVNCRVSQGETARVIAEMGGKNAIVVTSSAELDETVSGCIYSAFGHSGQKCSALSRLLVNASVADSFINRFTAAAQDLKIGPSHDYATVVNPVITFEDQKRLKLTAERIRQEAKEFGGKVWVDRVDESAHGFSVGPLVVELPATRAFQKESEAQKEHFGPFVHIIRYSNFKEAVQLFNSTEYALTGGIFSQSQDDIEFLLSKLEAGNLYVNRSCTGARVAIEPFGGFKHSGTGPKAGGPQYLHALVRQSRYSPVQTSSLDDELSIQDIETEKRITRLKELPAAEFLSTLSAPEGFNIRDAWTDFLNWSERCLPSLRTQGRLNRVIPGQESRQDLQLFRTEGLYIVTQETSSFACWQSLTAALVLGARVRVLLHENMNQRIWRSKIRRLKSIGFEIDEINYGNGDPFCSRHFYILDVAQNEIPDWMVRIYTSAATNRHRFPWMPKILSDHDGAPILDFDSLYETFFLNRAIAINTMRHGAPLEVSKK